MITFSQSLTPFAFTPPTFLFGIFYLVVKPQRILNNFLQMNFLRTMFVQDTMNPNVILLWFLSGSPKTTRSQSSRDKSALNASKSWSLKFLILMVFLSGHGLTLFILHSIMWWSEPYLLGDTLQSISKLSSGWQMAWSSIRPRLWVGLQLSTTWHKSCCESKAR